ncbi:MAG: pyruvate kinase [Bacteroidota bacterium]
MAKYSPKKTEKIQKLLQQINDLITAAQQAEKKYELQLLKAHPESLESARNLVHYRTLRMHDIRDLQKSLGSLGLSRLARAEAHIMASLLNARKLLQLMISEKKTPKPTGILSIKSGRRQIKTNSKRLFGYRSKGRRTRIMVTMPSQAATDYPLVDQIVAAGMNCARINCAHDDETSWKQMIQNIRKAAAKHKRSVKIAMDLAGPKIRTGAIVPGPRILKLRPIKDVRGVIRQPLRIWVGPEAPEQAVPHLPIAQDDLALLKEDSTLYLRDTRNKKRKIKIASITEKGAWADVKKTTYVETALPLHLDSKRQSPPIPVGNIPELGQTILLQKGDRLIIHKDRRHGEPTRYDSDGQLIETAHISCTSDAIFAEVKVAEPIRFDDGKIEGIIREVQSDQFTVEITNAGGRLRSDKGINLPVSELTIRGLTDKDRRDLPFVAAHADVINFSFVNTPQDVTDLLDALAALDAPPHIGIVLKIETQSGYNHLTDILLESMRGINTGVMIARGDLAIEVGWDNIARVQEEILALCQAAHFPDVWATQVLENLAKTGVPSRAEITDAAMAQRAECVMLNKGPHIVQAIQLLDTILKNMLPYRDKKNPMLPAMEQAGGGQQASI